MFNQILKLFMTRQDFIQFIENIETNFMENKEQ